MRIVRILAVLALPVCFSTSAHAGPADFLSGFKAAGDQEKAAYCWLAIGAKASDLSNAATEHGGLDIAAAEAAWKEIDTLQMRGLVIYRLLHLMGEAGAAEAEKAATDVYIETGVANQAKAWQQQHTVADLCAEDAFNAMVEKDGRVKLMETGFREALKDDRAQAKADFIKRATAPYHD